MRVRWGRSRSLPASSSCRAGPFASRRDHPVATACLKETPLSPEEIVAEIPHLTLAQIYAALAYYHANREEVESDIAAEEVEAEQLEREHFLSRKTS